MQEIAPNAAFTSNSVFLLTLLGKKRQQAFPFDLRKLQMIARSILLENARIEFHVIGDNQCAPGQRLQDVRPDFWKRGSRSYCNSYGHPLPASFSQS
ncbi:MAG TPA: hypothetical protein VGD98_26020 [Ktedonobacteraceae bacterium]